MKTIIQQEILLMTGTTFSSRLCWEENYGQEDQGYLSETEQLQEACCNGLLPAILPEICEQIEGDKKLYLWKIRENKSCIDIELGQFPEILEKNFSIDPYTFLALQSLS